MRTGIKAALAAVALALVVPAGAQAAAPAAAKMPHATGAVEQVTFGHWRKHRHHRHHRWGNWWGPRVYGYTYYSKPRHWHKRKWHKHRHHRHHRHHRRWR